jgi:hypothetical protein
MDLASAAETTSLDSPSNRGEMSSYNNVDSSVTDVAERVILAKAHSLTILTTTSRSFRATSYRPSSRSTSTSPFVASSPPSSVTRTLCPTPTVTTDDDGNGINNLLMISRDTQSLLLGYSLNWKNIILLDSRVACWNNDNRKVD